MNIDTISAAAAVEPAAVAACEQFGRAKRPSEPSPASRGDSWGEGG